MFITADQLFVHALGDYVLQSDWMALEKTKKYWVASVHAWVYSTPFMFLTSSWKALFVISITHAIIDRWRLAKYIVWIKNFLALPKYWASWKDCSDTGYHRDRPPWMSVWLLIICDNLLHIAVNALALRYL